MGDKSTKPIWGLIIHRPLNAKRHAFVLHSDDDALTEI